MRDKDFFLSKTKKINLTGIIFLGLFILVACQNKSESNHPEVQPEANYKLDRPNILVILTDDQGYHDVSYYGTKDIQTPHIDALTQDGMRFDNFYANCPVCSPTRASLMTGRYPDRVGVPGVIRTHDTDNWGFLDTNAVTLPEKLSEMGYHTALIGKWHLGLDSPNMPNERGFDFFHGWLGDMMDDYVKKRRHDINYMRRNQEVIDPEGHATDLFTQWSMDYIEQQAQEETPFFLYLAYNAPHFPVQPPSAWVDKVKAREPNLSDKRAKLVAFIEHLDDGIGRVINTLKEVGEYDNTLIVFTSDNGGLLRDMANNGPLRDGKQSMYEGGLKVPTSMVWKGGGLPSGSHTQYNALTMDLYPTLLEAAGGIAPDHIEGKSFLPILKGEEINDRDRLLYFVRREGNIRYGGLTIQAVRLNEWKLVQNSPFGPRELYNLSTDPLEEINLADQNPEKFKELNRLMMKQIQEGGRVPWQPLN